MVEYVIILVLIAAAKKRAPTRAVLIGRRVSSKTGEQAPLTTAGQAPGRLIANESAELQGSRVETSHRSSICTFASSRHYCA